MLSFAGILLLATLTLTVQGAQPSQNWPDINVKAPKHFVANIFGQGCNAQIVFHRDAKDQLYSYSVIANVDDQTDLELKQDSLVAWHPLAAVNASAGHQRGAYQLNGDPGYTLLPIQIQGCVDSRPAKTFQIKAVKGGSPTIWYSEKFNITSFTPPDMVTDLVAKRDAKERTKVTISWTASTNEYSTIKGAFVIFGKSTQGSKINNKVDNLSSSFVPSQQTSLTVVAANDAPMNVTVVRYSTGRNGALSFVTQAPQVLVK